MALGKLLPLSELWLFYLGHRDHSDLPGLQKEFTIEIIEGPHIFYYYYYYYY